MNVVVIVLDTFRHDIVGPGKRLSFVSTPNLDRFAEQGVSFEQAFGEGQPTLQVRRAFFTGRRSFPWRYNFDRRGHWHHAPGWHKIPPEQDTLAEILTSYGYTTGLVGDVYHMFKPSMNYWRGFSSYEFIRGQESDNYRTGSLEAIEKDIARHVREPINWERHSTLVQYLWNMRGRAGEEEYLCAQVMRRACSWLDDNSTDEPFLLWVEAFDPHEPWDPPKRFADRYTPGYTGKDFIMPPAGTEHGPMTPEEIERTRALYFGEVSFVDEWVGVLLDKLDATGLSEDTLVMILSDHGTEVYDRGGFGKAPKRVTGSTPEPSGCCAIPGDRAAGESTLSCRRTTSCRRFSTISEYLLKPTDAAFDRSSTKRRNRFATRSSSGGPSSQTATPPLSLPYERTSGTWFAASVVRMRIRSFSTSRRTRRKSATSSKHIPRLRASFRGRSKR